MTLSELIAALEAADGPSRQLDAQIALSHGWDVVPIREKGGRTWDRWYRPHAGKRYPVRLPLYTASIDAALTLVPKGFAWDLRGNRNGDGFARLSAPDGSSGFIHFAATPAHALCIAALKAREAKE